MPKPPEIPILMYHRIGTPNPKSIVSEHYVRAHQFERQLSLLKKLRYRSVSLDDMESRFDEQSEFRPFVITFDDGYESFLTEAVPILKKLDMAACVFLVSDLVGKTNEWDEKKGDVTERLMTAGQAKQCLTEGMQIGSHSATHADLCACDDEAARREIAGSKHTLEAMLGSPVRWFCYPYGNQSKKVQGFVEEAGYFGACATGKYTNRRGGNRFALARLNVRSTTSPAYLLYKLFKARRRRGPEDRPMR